MKKFLTILGILAVLGLVVPAYAITGISNFDVDVDVTSEMSLTCVAGGGLVHMLPAIPGVVGGSATGATTCNVLTSEAAGWELYIRDDAHNTASGNAGRLLRAGTGADKYNRFDAFGSTSVPAAWTATDQAVFGYNAAGTYAVAGFSGSKYAALYASDDGAGGGKGLLVAERTAPSSGTGDVTTFNFKAEFEPDATNASGPDHLVEGTTPATSYITSVEVTAVTK